MSVVKTSRLTYKQIIDDGLVGRMEEIVFDCIMDNPNIADTEISLLTGLRINQVTGRRNGLVDKGCVVDGGVGEINGRMVKLWKVPKVIDYVKPDYSKRKKCKFCCGKGWVIKK